MSAELQQFALRVFIADVVLPALQRRQQARANSRAGPSAWRTVWPSAEIVEAARLLRLGSVLGVFPPDSVDEVLGIANIVAGVADSELAPRGPGQAAFLGNTLSMLNQVGPLNDDSPARSRHALARARGLFRANVLCVSELGHGVAAEALARLLRGGLDACVEAVSSELRQHSRSAKSQLRVQALMADPSRDVKPASRLRGGVVAASMFHAVEFLYAVGYSHELREAPATVDGDGVDPLRTMIGISTGDILHQILYWRMPFASFEFKRSFLNLLRPSAELLFKYGLASEEADVNLSATEYAVELATRVSRAADTWATAFLVGAHGDTAGTVGAAGQGQLSAGLDADG